MVNNSVDVLITDRHKDILLFIQIALQNENMIYITASKPLHTVCALSCLVVAS